MKGVMRAALVEVVPCLSGRSMTPNSPGFVLKLLLGSGPHTVVGTPGAYLIRGGVSAGHGNVACSGRLIHDISEGRGEEGGGARLDECSQVSCHWQAYCAPTIFALTLPFRVTLMR